MSTVVGRTLTDGVIAALEAVSLTVGDGEQPEGSGWQGDVGLSSFVPYANVHAIPGGMTDGPINASDDDAQSLYQVTGVGATREQAEWVADTARAALITPGAVTVSGRTVSLITVDALGGARRDESVEPVVWMTADRFRVLTTP